MVRANMIDQYLPVVCGDHLCVAICNCIFSLLVRLDISLC